MMFAAPHHEKHFTASEMVRDIVIGMSDGLTVPFALAAGLTGTITSTHIIVIAGLSEIAAGAIAMGLGGYLAAKSDIDHYQSELLREQIEVREKPMAEKKEVDGLLRSYGLTPEESTAVVESLSQRPEKWVDFMMKFELGLERPNQKRVYTSAFTISISYIVGGLIPLGPYMFLNTTLAALHFSMIFTLVALLLFGYIKGRFMGVNPLKSGFQTVIIGGLAALAAFMIAKAVS